MSRRALDSWLPAAIIVAVVGALFAQTRHYGLLGFDSYPIILTSRVGSISDLLSTFTEKLMDGRYAGDFHRPLLNLTFAWDHAMWGLNPFGYQLSNALLLAGAAWALWHLSRRLLGPEATLGPLLGLSAFVLSSLQVEVLPVPARRPELLCCLFVALALALQLSPRTLASTRLSPWPALATLAAIASKETGYVVPLLIAVAVFLYSERDTPRARAAHVARVLVPHLTAAALMLGLRLIVLGGPGGHAAVSSGAFLSSVFAALYVLAGSLLLPQPAMATVPAGRWLLLALALALAATLSWAVLAGRGASTGPRSHAPRAAIVALGWIVLVGSVYAAAGLIGTWYLLLPLAGWSLLVGALSERLLALAAAEVRGLLPLATTALVLLVGLVVWQSSYSPVFRHYDEWDRASKAERSFLDETRAILTATPDGTSAEAPPMPGWAAPRGSPVVRGAAILADYSVQAWVELAFPERRIRVAYATPGLPPPSPKEVLLLITRRLDDI